MENCCLNCKNFKIWDGDPCCLHKDGWKIVLPSEICVNHDEETFKPVLQLRIEYWDKCKKEFFERYKIDQSLVEKYLLLFPEDKTLINQGNG